MIDRSPILLMITEEDVDYIPKFKPLLQGRNAFVITANPDTAMEISIYAKSRGIKYVITTNPVVLQTVVESKKKESLDNWNGSIYERFGITYLFLNPLKHLYSVPYGSFVMERFVSKVVDPGKWARTPDFSWELLNTTTVEQWFAKFKSALLLAEDIETVSFEEPLSLQELEQKRDIEFLTVIDMVSYTAYFPDGRIHSIVIPIAAGQGSIEEKSYWVTWMRKFRALPIPKIYQNGLYDNAHELSYGAPASSYYFDTQSLFHCWFSELPKRLDFIAAFTIHNVFYWKDMAKEGGYKKFEYNARDSWATLVSFINLCQELPDWAWNNYYLKFPLWVPCLYCNLEGMKVDPEARERLITHYIGEHQKVIARTKKWFGEGFEFNSPTQVTKLIQFYGSVDIPNADEKALRKFALRHPLNSLFVEEILNGKEAATILSRYLKPRDYKVSKSPSKKKTYLLHRGRIFYSLAPDGTDTGRLACKEGYNWTGSQIQNQTPLVKEMMLPDEDFLLYEIDNSQSEARCVAYGSGDQNLIATVESDKDYHALNAERFFGIPYREIIDADGKVILLDIRNLSKRTNHGANYNMGWFVLIETMGYANIDKAFKLLKLAERFPEKKWSRRAVAEYLLDSYDKSYPKVKADFYRYIVSCVQHTRMLVSALGWTRYCFGNPGTITADGYNVKNKLDLNAYVAHVPQNLSVGIINEAFMEIFWKVQVPNYKNFRIKAQIHDSILFQVRKGHEYLLKQVKECCNRPTTVKDCAGVERVMTIPTDLKGGPNWKEMKKVTLV
jgi:DNA polymerase I-like protein with 3'-5' exonuclease and polymerase domains